MGFEISYFYHERLPSGKWNMEERHEMKKKVGSPTEEVDLEKLAAIILTQLAKRDKLVIDVEVYEYSKRKINYKEATDGSGIVLKNKKFGPAFLEGELLAEDVEDETLQLNGPPGGNLAPNRNLAPLPRNEEAGRASNLGRVKMWMLFDPEIPMLHEAKKKGLKLTVGNKYPVYEAEDHPTGLGQVLTIVDDAGKKQLVADKYFVAATRVRLVGDDEVEGGFSTPVGVTRDEPRLSYGGNIKEDMPNLRPQLGRM